ncbi:DUF397 domain-containing protein [Cryptosporangium sp. NPDC048952]|uniref:DUF397 domain-containing protein n=1 Tax=Cryptosporangium sp. NPDC048952 TaxID=3363961 RepID=UPI003720F10A
MIRRVPTNNSGWRKATASGIGNCVEVRTVAGKVDIRDSKNPEAPHLSIPAHAFRDWIASLKDPSED